MRLDERVALFVIWTRDGMSGESAACRAGLGWPLSAAAEEMRRDIVDIEEEDYPRLFVESGDGDVRQALECVLRAYVAAGPGITFADLLYGPRGRTVAGRDVVVELLARHEGREAEGRLAL